MPGRGIQHIDPAVTDVDRSLAFYMDLLGPLGLREFERYPTYRGTEEVVYPSFGDESLGLRPADGGGHRYYDVGLEHLAFEVDTNEEVEAAHERCLRRAIGSTARRRRTATSRVTTHSLCSIRMDSASRSSRPGRNGPRAFTGLP
jgi:catechol 2,3-dioxygenase-like lactoylglutathione lyase family enzyme